jgi:hypothetical protein
MSPLQRESIARVLERDPELLAAAEGRAGQTLNTPGADRQIWPEPLECEVFHGLAGEIVRTIEPHSEADPAALLLQFLAAFGNAIGGSAHFDVEHTPHHTNLFIVLVGETAKGRKGTSLSQIRSLFRALEPEWEHKRVVSGLSSGEGLIWAVHDPIEKQEPVREGGTTSGCRTVIADEGVADKRLLVVEQEFSSSLRVMERQGATLSAVLRDAWDSGSLSSLTKNSPARATGAHISIVAHVTRQELLRYLTETESANGFGNRFLWVCVRRSKCLPEGGAVDADSLLLIMGRLRAAVEFARNSGAMHRDENARAMWQRVYADLSDGRPGLLGSITSRAEAQVLRLSMIYALLECSSEIRKEHLAAALAVWDYCLASARYIFGDALGMPEADRILEALQETPEGLTRAEVSALFHRHKNASQLDNALRLLSERGFAEVAVIQTDGRDAAVWHAVTSIAKKAKEAKKGVVGTPEGLG